MEAEERNDIGGQAEILRSELKIWEKDIAAKTGGSKPSREDIKSNPSIAKKYSQYNKLRDILSGKRPYQKSSSPAPRSRKRKHEELQTTTPSKRLAATPLKAAVHPSRIDPYDSPSLVRKLFTPSQSRTIGPTPQKDGIPLGLFDVLSEEGTPHKDTAGALNRPQATPSRRSQVETELASAQKHSRTPASSGKRFMLSAFMTPSRVSAENPQKTPQSTVSKLNFFATPSFLRRGGATSKHLPSISESQDAEPTSPGMLPGPRKPLIRGLSSMLKSLRNMEEEAADEDLDILRELEADSASTQPTKQRSGPVPVEVQVEDSQARHNLLGGFDDEAMFDSEPEEALDRGQALKVYKKKGQKRTTRKVNMKPSRVKPAAARAVREPESDEEDELSQVVPPDLHEDIENTEALIPETQQANPDGFADARNFDTDSSGSEYTASEGGTRYRRPNQKKKTKSKGADGKEKSGGRAKKVGAMAQQNFKRLKLRNTGSKGGPGHSSRFRRKR